MLSFSILPVGLYATNQIRYFKITKLEKNIQNVAMTYKVVKKARRKIRVATK